MSACAALMPLYAELDLGAVATSTTASASGMRASGSPTALAMSTAALTMGMICGHASPTSSQAQTIRRRQALGRSPASNSRAR